MFKYQPRPDTPFIEILHDSIQIERDLQKAEEARKQAEIKAAQQARLMAAMQAKVAARSRRRR